MNGERRWRQLLPGARIAYELLPTFGTRKIPITEFELRMNERGCWGNELKNGILGLVRRGWVTTDKSMLTITDEGWSAVVTGEGVPALKAKPRVRRAKHARMPAGLFQ
jgi:hypothetical protein